MKNQWLLLTLVLTVGVGVGVECFYKAQMPEGFRLSPNFNSEGKGEFQFQPVLFSPSGDFALGFYRVEKNSLLLSVAYMEMKEKEIVWSGNTNNAVTTDCIFVQDATGSVSLLDERGRDVWHVNVEAKPHAVLVLLDTGNLQLQVKDKVEWQSFDHPTDTLLEGQNFTASMKLISWGGAYSLQMEAAGMSLRWNSELQQVYWRRAAMQEKARIVAGKGQIYARLEADGYIAMYQSESQLVDVIPLDTYHDKLRLTRRLKIESDGNLRCYYWRDDRHVWELDFQAVQSVCHLPNFCGASALCTLDNRCTCITADGDGNGDRNPNGDSKGNGVCLSTTNGVGLATVTAVDLPYSQFVRFVSVELEKDCVGLCLNASNCAAALFYRNSKQCYQVPSPLPMLLQVPTHDKLAFLKLVNNSGGSSKYKKRFVGVVVGGGLTLLCASSCVILLIIWRCRRTKKRIYIELTSLSYRELGPSISPN